MKVLLAGSGAAIVDLQAARQFLQLRGYGASLATDHSKVLSALSQGHFDFVIAQVGWVSGKPFPA